MTTRTKEEERLLDEKIARIQKKNEEILRREKEIEEDKRLAAKQNAIVQLRSTSTNDSRERTPALRLSKREFEKNPQLENDDSADVYSKNSDNSVPRGRGARRGRERADRSDNGPPPDPRSYLADSERDPIPPSKDGRSDRGDEFRSNRGGRGEERGSSRGGREFQRGGRRGQGKPERGRGRNEDAWRAERNRIDEERIQRQKSSDGSWRREWDNEKIEQELGEERNDGTRSGMNTGPRADRWKSNYNQQSNQRSGEFDFDRPNRGSRGTRGHRGRPDSYDQLYLEKSIPHPRAQHYAGRSPRHNEEDWDQQHAGKSPLSPRQNVDDHVFASAHYAEDPVLVRRIPNQLASDKAHFKGELGIVKTIDNITPKTILKYPTTAERSVIDVGGSFKILVPNSDAALESATASSKAPRRPNYDMRQRHKSQASYSSQSEDETHLSPRDRGYRFNRNNPNKSHSKHNVAQHLKTVEKRQMEADTSNKPPLPSFRSSQPEPKISNEEGKKEVEDGEESWEDVTTSGTESMGEDVVSAHSSPNNVVNKCTANENIAMQCIYTPEDFLIMQRYDDTNIEQSINFYSEDNTDSFENDIESNATLIEQKFKDNVEENECSKEDTENKQITKEAKKLLNNQEKTDSVKTLTSKEDYNTVENIGALNISENLNCDLKEFKDNTHEDKTNLIQTSDEMPKAIIIEDNVKTDSIENIVNNDVKEIETCDMQIKISNE